MKRDALVILHSDWAVFLCGFFYGASKGLPGVEAVTPERIKFRDSAGSNFRRIYAKLTEQEKIQFRKEIAAFEKCPLDAVNDLIDSLTDAKNLLE